MGVPSTLDFGHRDQAVLPLDICFCDSRRDRELKYPSLDDPRLSNWRIGIHMVGDDYAPPAHAAGPPRALHANIVGFSLFGADRRAEPARHGSSMRSDARRCRCRDRLGTVRRIFRKSARGIALTSCPFRPPCSCGVPFTYDISVGVRKGDDALRAELDGALENGICARSSRS